MQYLDVLKEEFESSSMASSAVIAGAGFFICVLELDGGASFLSTVNKKYAYFTAQKIFVTLHLGHNEAVQ